MKKLKTLLIAILSVVVLALCVACGGGDTPSGPVDYVSRLKLDLTSNSKKQEVTVRLYIDGDTTHFNPVKNSTVTGYNAEDFASTDGYIKARYISINTPENTGKIEEWGSTAAKFVRSKLETAESIIVESDDDKWNIDSSSSHRYVVWVWYKPKGGADYRNLNIEILQEGLALDSSASQNRYGPTASAAVAQARKLQLYVFSNKLDPDYPYGEATPITLKELRCNVNDYVGKKIKTEGIVVADFNNSAYIEDFDPDVGVYFGFPVYYGFTPGRLLNILKVGYRVSVVGVVNEFYGTYQISGVSYDEFAPYDADNSKVISKDNERAFTVTSAKDIVEGKLSIDFEKKEENENGDIVTVTDTKTFDYAEAVMSTSVTVENLTVEDIWVTKSGNSAGAMSLTCSAKVGNETVTIVVRTEVFKDEDGEAIGKEVYENKKITVKGIVDKYENEGSTQQISPYQVKVYRADFIEILN